MTGKLRSEDVRITMSERQTGSGNTLYGKPHTDQPKALPRGAAFSRERDPNQSRLSSNSSGLGGCK